MILVPSQDGIKTATFPLTKEAMGKTGTHQLGNRASESIRGLVQDGNLLPDMPLAGLVVASVFECVTNIKVCLLRLGLTSLAPKGAISCLGNPGHDRIL